MRSKLEKRKKTRHNVRKHHILEVTYDENFCTQRL